VTKELNIIKLSELLKIKTEIRSRNTTEQISSKDKYIFHSSRIICRPDKFAAAKVHLLRLAEKPAVKFIKPAVYQKNTA